MNKLLKAILITVLIANSSAYAGFKEHFDLGQQYLSNYQYSGAITEFKNALRINYMDNSARIGLINSYIARAAYYGNTEHNYQKASNDYRSALFYMMYYPEKVTSNQYIPQINSNLNACLNYIKFDKSAKNRFEYAQKLRAEGDFAAAGYEFNQAISDREYQKASFEQVGDIMKLLGNNLKAAEFYKKAVAVAPNDVNLRLSYAKMLDTIGDEDNAVSEYNYILSKTSDNKDVLYSLERIYVKKIEKSPNDADLMANLGAILQKEGKYDEALMYYQKSEYLNPSNINTRINVGTLYQQKGDLKTALKAYDSVLILYPDNINANLYKADAYAALGDSKNALEGYKRVLTLQPDNTQAQSQMLNLIKSNMSTTQFVEYVKKNMASSNPAELFYNYAIDLHKQNKFDDAILMYAEALKINDNDAEIFLNMAIAQNQSGSADSALNTLKTAALKFPNNKEIKNAILSINNDIITSKLEKAAAYYDKKEYKKAIDEYTKIEPAVVDSVLGIASCYQALEDNKSALSYYLEAFKMKPTDSDIAYYIAVIYSEMDDLDSAKAYLNKSIAINKNNAKSIEFLKSLNSQLTLNLLNKAIEEFEAENYDNALKLLNQVIVSEEDNSYAYYYRGMIYDNKNKKNDAINDFKKAYTLNKDFEIANYLIAVDYDSMEKYKDAYTYYQKYATSSAPDDEYKAYAKTRIEELKDYAK